MSSYKARVCCAAGGDCGVVAGCCCASVPTPEAELCSRARARTAQRARSNTYLAAAARWPGWGAECKRLGAPCCWLEKLVVYKAPLSWRPHPSLRICILCGRQAARVRRMPKKKERAGPRRARLAGLSVPMQNGGCNTTHQPGGREEEEGGGKAKKNAWGPAPRHLCTAAMACNGDVMCKQLDYKQRVIDDRQRRLGSKYALRGWRQEAKPNQPVTGTHSAPRT